MNIDHRAPVAPNHSVNPRLAQPAPLGPQFQYLKEGQDTVLVSPDKSQPATTRSSEEVVTEYATGFHTCMFQPGGLTREYVTNFSTGTELNMARADAPANAELPDAPAHADTLLAPAVESVLKCEEVLRSEDPALLRDEDLVLVLAALGQAKGYQEMLDILDPLVHGLMARKVQAQVILADFCTRLYKNGSSAINRNRILLKGMAPLKKFATQSAATAQDTKHLIAQVAHQTEAETLDRVKLAQQGSPTGPAPGGAGSPGAGTGVVGIPLQGAHAPGHNPVPPGAMPTVANLPVPQHPKPKRRSGGTTASKKKAKPTQPG